MIAKKERISRVFQILCGLFRKTVLLLELLDGILSLYYDILPFVAVLEYGFVWASKASQC